MESDKTVYLDHAGATIPSKSLLTAVFDELMVMSLGNPHSNGKFSSKSDLLVNEARSSILKHFNISSSEYEIVFTAGATASIKMVAETFPWSPKSFLCHPRNSHSSLLGIRAYSPNTVCIPSKELQLDSYSSIFNTDDLDVVAGYNLLVVPGECNFSGSKANISGEGSFIRHCCLQRGISFLNGIEGSAVTKVSEASSTDNDYSWLWLLDAAKLASTTPIDLSALPCPPHFVAVSFYKMFGYPTGLGALLIRRDTLPLLNKK